MKVTLTSFKYGEEITFECLAWDFSSKGNVYQFYKDEGGKIIEKAFSVYNWDLTDIEYETTASDSNKF